MLTQQPEGGQLFTGTQHVSGTQQAVGTQQAGWLQVSEVGDCMVLLLVIGIAVIRNVTAERQPLPIRQTGPVGKGRRKSSLAISYPTQLAPESLLRRSRYTDVGSASYERYRNGFHSGRSGACWRGGGGASRPGTVACGVASLVADGLLAESLLAMAGGVVGS
jgi:hypothetical protein